MQFVVVKDDVEIDISVQLQDKFVFHTVSKITGRSAKKKTTCDFDVNVFYQQE